MRNKLFNLSAKGSLTVVLVLLTFFGWSQNSRKIVINPNSNQHTVQFVSEVNNEIEIKFNLNELNLRAVNTESGVAYVVESFNAPKVLNSGDPDLFYLAKSIVIPDMGSMVVEVIPGEYQEIMDIDIAPSKGNLLRTVNPDDVPFVKGDVYNENAFYPKNIASLNTPYIVRDVRGQTINVFPVQYNPVTKTLRIYSDLKVIVKHTAKSGVNEFVRTREVKSIDTEFSSIYKKMFLNYDQAKYTSVEEDGEVLVICYDDFMPAMQPYVNWKNTIGRKTTMVSKTIAGATSAAIKTYITNFYNNPDNNLTFVILVGDAPQIPVNSVSGSGDSDNAYGYITGNDSYNEILIGRFSAENIGHVETQVERVIHYERDINASDTWLNIGLGIAANEGSGNGHNGGEADYQHIDFVRDTLLNFTYSEVNREYSGGVPGLPNTTAAQISQRLNDGTSIINFCNHGSVTGWSVAGYSNTHVNALTNVNKLPFIISVACVNGDFKTNFCFAEAWTRATDNGSPTGAIATLMSTINQAWQPPMTGQDEITNILTENFQNNIRRTLAGITVNGSMIMLDQHGASGKQTHDTWVVFGDPSLLVRTDVPQAMNVSHNPTLFLGASTFAVSCDTDGAVATLSYTNTNGNVVMVGTGEVENGNLTIAFAEPITQPVDLTLAIVAFNKVTYMAEVAAVPADEPYIVMNSFETTAAPDFGQALGLNVILKNISNDPYTATNVVAILSTESQYATITNSTLSAGTIIPDQVSDFANAFGITITNNVPDQTAIPFVIAISGNYNGQTYNWSQTFIIKANAPLLKVQEFVINDNNQGIPGVLDPGETADLVVTVVNSGHANAAGIAGNLTTQSPYLTISQHSANIDALAMGATGVATFTVSAKPTTPLEITAIANLALTSLGNTTVNPIGIVIGEMPGYNMSNTTLTTCMARFYDPNGPDNNYSSNTNTTMTFLPASVGAMMRVSFESFATETNYDKLRIYDGTSSSAPQLALLSGSTLPDDYVATNPVGALTFVFTSDVSVNGAGWSAVVSCDGGVENDANLLSFNFEENVIEQIAISEVANNVATIDVTVAVGTNINALTPTITISMGAQITPEPGVVTNFTNEVTYSITSMNGAVINNYIVNVVEFVPIYNVTFIVLNEGSPIHGAMIEIDGQSVITNENGLANVSITNGDFDYVISATGYVNYTSILTIDGGNFTEMVNMQKVGIHSEQFSKIDAYPNPFANEIILENVSDVTQFTISNAVGSQIINVVNDGSDMVTITTNHIPAGFYLITFRTNNGDIHVKKMIKQ
ncbi:MAG: C25 family cysteine peptidase [Salinivirgaceae bacterium]|nr:C25 family cysteine peptidase [Salinivirgaceae bacterium]